MDEFCERITLRYVSEGDGDCTDFIKTIERRDAIFLEEVAEAVLQFLNGAGYTYVTNVVFTKTGGDEVSAL